MSTPVDHSPARLSSVLGIIAGLFALASLVVAGVTFSLIVGLVGMIGVISGIRRGSRNILTLGGLGLLIGVVLVGLLGAHPVLLLIGVIAVALTWDIGENAITIGERLGREAETHQIEITHLAATTGIVALAAGSGYFVYQLSVEGESPIALVALLLAAVILTVGLRN